jgi:uncharacterized protein
VRTVVDANIWVSALISARGAPARLEVAYREERFTVITSEPMLDEVEGVLRRPRIARRYAVTDERISGLVELFRNRAEIVEITGTLRVCRDPDDDMVVETAILGKADVVISGDDDLLADPPVLELLDEHGIEVWTVRRFVEWLDENGPGAE